MELFGEHRIDEPLCGGPDAFDIPVMEYAGIESFVASADRRCQRGIVAHRKVQIERMFLIRLPDPLLIEPIRRLRRIAGEPEFGLRHRASCERLFHEGTRHQSDLIEEHPRERDALNEGSRALILAAEAVEAVASSAKTDLEIPAADLLRDPKADCLQQRRQRLEQIVAERRSCLAAERKIALLKCGCRPEYKPERQRRCLTGAHSTVTVHRIKRACLRILPPPDRLTLFRRKRHRHLQAPPPPPSDRPAAPAPAFPQHRPRPQRPRIRAACSSR